MIEAWPIRSAADAIGASHSIQSDERKSSRRRNMALCHLKADLAAASKAAGIRPEYSSAPQAGITHDGRHFRFVPKADPCTAKSWLPAALVQLGPLPINHIAPARRTLAPSA